MKTNSKLRPINNKLAPIQTFLALMAATALLLWSGLAAQTQTTIFSDDFNRGSLGGTYAISQGGGGGTTLWLTNGNPGGYVSVATNISTSSLFNATLDSCAGPVAWTFNMRFGRTGNTPSGFGSTSYGNGVADFTVVSAATLTTALSAVAATITTSGPGQFRATIPASTPAAIYRMKR